MTVQIVPTDDTGQSFYSQLTTLEGTAYQLSFAYSQREDCWYLSVATSEGDDIYNGVKLICNWPLLKNCADPRMPPGEMWVFSATADVDPPGRLDLAPGSRCVLNYFTSDLLP